MATRHVFRPTRPLFSANINVRSNEQVERERLANEQSRLGIEQSQMSIEQLRKTIAEYDRKQEEELQYKNALQTLQTVEDDPDIIAQGISTIRRHFKPEEYQKDVQSRLNILKDNFNFDELDDTSKDYLKTKEGENALRNYETYGSPNALNKLKANLSKRITKTGLDRITGPEQDTIDAQKYTQFKADLRNDAKKNPDAYTEDQLALINSGQISHDLFGLAQQRGIKNADYLQYKATSEGDRVETRTDQYGNKLKQSVTDKNIQDLIIDYINTGFRSQESTDRWMQIIESDSGNETLRSNLQTRMADLKIAKRLPKTLSSWFSPTESTIEGVLEKDDKTGKYKQEKLLNDTKRESPELYDLLMAYEGLKSSRPSLYFQHYLDKVMLEERRNLLNNRNKPETPNFNAY